MSDNPLAISRPGFGDAPVGSVLAFAGGLATPQPATSSPPDESPPDQKHATAHLEAWGWMLCDGRSLCVGQYPELFDILGYLYGGSYLTFNIPDYRGAFLRGTDLGAGKDPDVGERTGASGGTDKYDNVGSRQRSAVQDHEHIVPVQATAAQGAPVQGLLTGSQQTQQTGGVYKDPAVDPPIVSPNESRPANIAVNYIIKFTYGLAPFEG
jgi:microcystin-dependent protein